MTKTDPDSETLVARVAADRPTAQRIGDLLAETMYGLYNHDLTPRAHAVSVFRRALRGSGMKLRSLMRVGWHAVRPPVCGATCL